jgi:hypothetical protein
VSIKARVDAASIEIDGLGPMSVAVIMSAGPAEGPTDQAIETTGTPIRADLIAALNRAPILPKVRRSTTVLLRMASAIRRSPSASRRGIG